MFPTGSPGLRFSWRNWKDCCLPGRITYLADTLAMLGRCRSPLVNDLPMIYRIVHRTTYKYRYPVSVGTHVACLKPRAMAHQQPAKSELHVQPRPATRTDRV